MKNLLIAFAALLLVSSVTLLLISSCKKKDDPIAVDGVTISPATASVAAGATVPLKTTVTPENAADKSLTWNSSDNNIATVAEGVVTGKSAGTAVITAASHSNPDKSASCTVTVTVAVEGVALLAEGGGGGGAGGKRRHPRPWGGGGGVSVATGATLQLTVAVTPENATDKSLTWTSSDDNLATVSADGIVTGRSPGTAIITVASKSNPDKSARCTVTVTAAAVEGVAISPPETSVKGDLTVKLTAIVTPQNVADKSVTWTSGDAGIAIVSADGTVTGKSPGTVTITAVSKSNPSKSASCPVTVTSDIVPLTALGVNPSSVSMLANGTQRLVAIFTPENASDKAVTWTSSNETVAVVSSDGLVTAKAIAGTATITLKSTNRQTISATCLVTVTTTSVAVTGISVDPVTLSLEAGADRQLRAGVTPSGATNQNVTYVSSASSVASVSETGLVRALEAGTAVITVTSVSDATKTARCEVTVTAAPVAVASISVDPVTLSLEAGAARQLRAVVTPENATNQNVTYQSSASSVASVSGTGLVRALGAGTAVITVKSVSDPTKTAACAGTVTDASVAVAGISVEPVTLSLATGTARQLRAVITPENATNQNVTYVSSVPSVASVSGTGLVRALAVGTTVITVTSVSDATKTATCAVTVLSNDASVSAIALGDENFPLTVPSAGGTTTLNNAPRTVASDITAVKVTLTAAAGASIKIGNEAFIIGGTANFSAPVAFTVTAQDGVTVRTYTAAITAYDAASNPYGIYTVAHLNDVRNNKAGSYKMMNNIVLPARDAAGAVATGISDYADKGWLPIAHDAEAGGGGAFTGKFDGGNFFVDNFYINRNAAGDNYTGLFGRTSGA